MWSIPKAQRKTFVNRDKEMKEKKKGYCSKGKNRVFNMDEYYKVIGSFGTRGPKYTIQGKRKEPKVKESPGPGDYYIPCSFASTPSYVNVKRPFKQV